MSRPTKLSEKHWQVLDMLDKGMTRSDIAKEIGWTRDHLDKLCVGNVEKAGGVATLFKAEYQKVSAKITRETNELIQNNLKQAQRLMQGVFNEIESKKKVSAEDKKILSMYTNAIAKCQPSPSIKNLSFSYTKGLSAEELMYEFKRLKTIAESSFERGGISEAAAGRAGELPEVDE